MKFFKREDFCGYFYAPRESDVPAALAKLANDKLEREGKVVYQYNKGFWSQVPVKTFNGAELKDHKALLINVEPIEKCSHPKEKVKWNCDRIGSTTFWCECGARVQPKEFEEVE